MARDRQFESTFLHRRVRCKPDFLDQGIEDPATDLKFEPVRGIGTIYAYTMTILATRWRPISPEVFSWSIVHS